MGRDSRRQAISAAVNMSAKELARDSVVNEIA